MMKQLLNTLFVMTEDAYLALENDNVVIYQNDKTLAKVPLRSIEGIMCFSYKGASPALMGRCGKLGISMAFYSPRGHYYCSVLGEENRNVLLRREQFRVADDEQKSLRYAKSFIVGKLYNAKWVLERTKRDHALRVNIDRLAEQSGKLSAALLKADDFFSPIADESKALHDDISDALNATNVQYAKIFSRVLRGYEGAEDLKKHNDPMVVVILDAATTGRLGVTFYCELQKDEYIKRILQWHVDAAWPLTFFKKSIVEGAERVNVVQYEGAPSFTDIINCACGTSDRSSKSYKRFAKDVKERLIECMFGGAQFPMSILNAACHKVTRPMGYDNIRVWRRDFEIACSLWKKHYIDETRKQHRQEDVITMYLEPNRDDRDYLYGRLLALADNFEESVLRKQGVKDRPTNAIKLMSNFTAKPYTTWGTLWKQLMPYLKSANGGSWFRNEVDDVMALFKEGDFEDNKALSPMFLLGYSCQRRASKRKAQEISQKNNSNN